jgi:hypothetical protein
MSQLCLHGVQHWPQLHPLTEKAAQVWMVMRRRSQAMGLAEGTAPGAMTLPAPGAVALARAR